MPALICFDIRYTAVQIIVADTGNGCIRKILGGEGDYIGASLLSGQTQCETDGKCKGIKGPPSPWRAPVDVAATPDGGPLPTTITSMITAVAIRLYLGMLKVEFPVCSQGTFEDK